MMRASAYAPPRPGVRRRKPARRHRGRRIARALLLCGCELGAAAALVLVISSSAAAPSAPGDPGALTTEVVAKSPATYRTRDVRVRGHVAEWPKEIKRRDQGTFVMEGSAGARLLVVPAGRERLRAFTVGTVVTVFGSVVIPPDNMRLERRPTSRTAIAKRTHAPALIEATRVEFAG